MQKTRNEALNLIKKALSATVPRTNLDDLKPETHLLKDGIIDSLDSMAFLYELETLCNKKFKEIDDHFTDFRIERLVSIVCENE